MEESSGFNIDIPHEEGYDVYTVLRLVHESQTGVCRILEVRRGDRIYVAKSLKSEYRSSRAHIDLLRMESAILSSLYHPAIIQSYGMTELPGEGPALILEYAHGVTLRSFIDDGRLTPRQARNILDQLCNAIDYCHRRNIVHRDLKPSNIMVFPEGPIIKVIDFNLSHDINNLSTPVKGGTRGFSAPEQLEEGAAASPASDIWSMGKIMLEMLPEGDRRWKKTARLCMSPKLSERPSASGIIAMLNQADKRRRRFLMTFAGLAVAAIIGTGIYLLPVHPGDENGIAYHDGTEAPVPTDSASHAEKAEDTYGATPPIGRTAVVSEDATFPAAADTGNGETVTGSSAPVAETVSGSGNSMGTSIPGNLRNRLDGISRQMAEKRYREHIAILDTCRSVRSLELGSVRHWCWLAKQDVGRWIGQQSVTATVADSMQKRAADIIGRCELEHRKEHGIALRKAFQRTGIVVSTDETGTYPDKKVRHYLTEDGVWHKETIEIPPSERKDNGKRRWMPD